MQKLMQNPRLILASTSPYRRALLEKLHIDFDVAAPNVDESPLPNETAAALVARLAQLKAQTIATKHTDALVIGSDQLAVCDNKIIGKPLDHQSAINQLGKFSGRQVTFLTGLSLINSKTANIQTVVEPFSVYFRQLTPAQIEHYLLTEKPYDCAGSFKCEGMGICLFEKMLGDDPNTLVGLPLIRLVELLNNEGVDVLASPA